MTEFIKNPKDPKKIIEQRENHWTKIKELDGSIITLPTGYMGLDRLKIPEGFVVNGRVDKEITDLILADAIPLRPIGVPTMRQNADQMIREAKELLKVDDVLLLALPDNVNKSSWSISFIAVRDLYTEDPYFLLEESDNALREGNIILANCKTCAYSALTGEL
jgi:hypothetical protein